MTCHSVNLNIEIANYMDLRRSVCLTCMHLCNRRGVMLSCSRWEAICPEYATTASTATSATDSQTARL